ncbi:MAG: hypothetical protein KJ732_06470, partial [Candidatus Margulisbacteria bacterium]|nr:hypothetical protein [Candidatus Margulisiibacteriota bacterium]
MKKINLAQVVNQLSLGGTEKSLEIFSRYLDKDLFNLAVFAAKSGGERYEQLKDSFPTFILNEHKAQFVNLLKERKIDILHVHRAGSEEPFVLAAAKEANVPIIVETKVFGQTDKSQSAKAIDLSIFVSKMCALRYIKKNQLSVEDFFKNN